MIYGCQRILIKNGGSYSVTIPRHFLMHMALFRGCPLKLEYDDDTETMTVRRAEPRPQGIYAVANARGVRPKL
jgi:antitoxin component of MazEF toxin-antitoxin module